MPKYLCLQRSLDKRSASPPSPPPSPSQMDEMYARFNAWQDTFKDNIADMGGRVGQSVLVTDDGQEDGPFVEVKELVGGYMVIEAESMDEAATIARACPGVVQPGSGIEVFEIHTS